MSLLKDSTSLFLTSNGLSSMTLKLSQEISKPALPIEVFYSSLLYIKNLVDLQSVNITLRVLYRPDADKLSLLHRYLGPEYDERVLPSIVNEVLRTVVAKYNAAALLSQRDQVSSTIRSTLEARARHFYLILDDVSITHLTFGKEFSEAIEAKQVAQQIAERAKYIVDQAREDKKSIIIKAQAEATSAELIGKAVKDNPSNVLFCILSKWASFLGT